MEILYTERFKKRFKKIPQKIQVKFGEKIDLFIKNQRDSKLKIHPLKGNMVGYRAFSVTGDYRVIYKVISPESIKLIDMGLIAKFISNPSRSLPQQPAPFPLENPVQVGYNEFTLIQP